MKIKGALEMKEPPSIKRFGLNPFKCRRFKNLNYICRWNGNVNPG